MYIQKLMQIMQVCVECNSQQCEKISKPFMKFTPKLINSEFSEEQ